MRKRKGIKRLMWVMAAFIMAGITLYFFLLREWEAQQEEQAKLAHYTAFGIDIPSGYQIHGIDVSSHQGSIYWPAVRSMKVQETQMGFVFIKATEGLNDADKNFSRNWKRAKQAGMACGAYHFFLATKSGREQALNFISQVQLKKGDLPPVLDIEQLYGVKPELARSRLKEWLDVVEAHYGVKPLIYSYADFYERNLGKVFEDYPLWVAHYTEPLMPRVNRPWTFWQHSDQGRVNGINSRVDCNVFNGDSLQWQKILIKY